MKTILLLSLLMTSLAWSQDELSDTEKEMVELGRKSMNHQPAPQASPALQARMQAEAGVFEDESDCKYDLVGTNMLTETVVEPGELAVAACQKKAEAALSASHKNFTKVVIKHKSSTKEIVIIRKK